jgi:hypothetical protein
MGGGNGDSFLVFNPECPHKPKMIFKKFKSI